MRPGALSGPTTDAHRSAGVHDAGDPGGGRLVIRRQFTCRAGGSFAWRSATPADAPLIWRWWTAPDNPYWTWQQRLARVSRPPFDDGSVHAYLRHYAEMPPNRRPFDPIVGLLDSEVPVAYAELYDKTASPYASHPILADVEPASRGMHLLVADRAARLRGLTLDIALDTLDWQFGDFPAASHCIADPDVRNQPALRLCARLGLERRGLVDLGFRTACVMVIERAHWASEKENLESMVRPLERLAVTRPRPHVVTRRAPSRIEGRK